MPLVEVSQPVPLAPEAVYAKISDMESFPRFMESVRSVTVLEASPGRTLTRWQADLHGASFVWVEEDLFFPEEGRIAYHLVSGDLRKFEGEWRIEPTAEGCLVTLTVDFDFGIPMLAQLLNPVAKVMIRKNSEAMLLALARELSP